MFINKSCNHNKNHLALNLLSPTGDTLLWTAHNCIKHPRDSPKITKFSPDSFYKTLKYCKVTNMMAGNVIYTRCLTPTKHKATSAWAWSSSKTFTSFSRLSLVSICSWSIFLNLHPFTRHSTKPNDKPKIQTGRKI